MTDANPVGSPCNGQLAKPDNCLVYAEGDDVYAAMLEDISRARHNIRLESYIFAGDEIGWLISEALAERAGAGVRVQVHLDAAGTLFEGTEKLFRFLDAQGVEMRWFNRWRWRDPLHYNRRNHRKLLLVDDTSVFLGGFNIHRQSSQTYVGAQRWRDVHVRLSAGLIRQAARLFDESWAGRTHGSAPPPWEGPYRVVPNSSRICRRSMHCMFLNALASARRTVYLASPYFVPDHRFRDALAAASQRGVTVKVLLPATGDNRLARWAGHALARPLARQGVQFFEYLPRMLHSKLALIDDSWVMVGSANADYRSFFINQELNLVSRAPALCEQLKSVFLEDLNQSRRWNASLRHHGPLQKLAEALGHRLRRWF